MLLLQSLTDMIQIHNQESNHRTKSMIQVEKNQPSTHLSLIKNTTQNPSMNLSQQTTVERTKSPSLILLDYASVTIPEDSPDLMESIV